MSRRIFDNFFDAYVEYFGDTFVPQQFQQWGCLSAVGAALERKVWLPWSDSWSCYPNIYVLFVSGPGEGKTQALNNAVDLLEDANKRLGGTINVLPNQATEAAFIKLLGHGRNFTIGTNIVFQNAAFYRAAEASASLRNVYGEFLACLTDLYDCPNRWERATVKDGITPITLKNVCINLLAASTFDYLGELVNDKNIMGGFASRLIYVLSQKREVVAQRFQNGGQSEEVRTNRAEYRKALIEDFMTIHKMQGKMIASPEFAQAWETWWVSSETQRKSYGSEKLQSLLVRQNLHMLKTSMILSACESDELVLHRRHWDKALELVEPAMKNIPTIFRESRAGSIDRGVKNIPHAIINAVMKNPNINRDMLKTQLHMNGAPMRDIDTMLHQMLVSGRLGLEGNKFVILGDPDHYL